MIESLLLAVTRVSTWIGNTSLTNATGFFFHRDNNWFLITNRHVVCNEPTNHRPDRLQIELHIDPQNASKITNFSIPIYDENDVPLWKEGFDTAGTIDIVAVKIDRAALPPTLLIQAFTPDHLVKDLDQVEVGTSVLIVGFPLGFHDDLHHLPVARQAVVASSFGMRFEGKGYFLTDAHMHRGASGSPVVARLTGPSTPGRDRLPWKLLGVHASRIDVERDIREDERLNLNCAWYADVLMTLTEPEESEKRQEKPLVSPHASMLNPALLPTEARSA